MVDEKKKKTMVVESSNKENKNYLTREEFINKLKANSLEIKNNEINERNAKNDISFEPLRTTKTNNYKRSDRTHTRSNYKNYTRHKVNKVNESSSFAPIVCGLFLITILFMKFVNIPIISEAKYFINDSISEVKPIEEVFNNFFVFNDSNDIEESIEEFSFSETIENTENYENISIEKLKTMTDFEIEEDLFLEKK